MNTANHSPNCVLIVLIILLIIFQIFQTIYTTQKLSLSNESANQEVGIQKVNYRKKNIENSTTILNKLVGKDSKIDNLNKKRDTLLNPDILPIHFTDAPNDKQKYNNKKVVTYNTTVHVGQYFNNTYIRNINNEKYNRTFEANRPFPEENITFSINDETQLTVEVLKQLKMLIKCGKEDFDYLKKRHGDYQVYVNYVKAEHGELECYEHVTLATHGYFTHLRNLEGLVQRWSGPVSMAIYCPGTDLLTTLQSIRYLRQCAKQKDLIRKWVTFHLYFPDIYFNDEFYKIGQYNCSSVPPYAMNYNETFKYRKNLIYPVNVARNIASDASLTYYVLSLDIDFYPSSFLGARFLNMLARNPSLAGYEKNKVFVVKQFEILDHQKIFFNKTELLNLYHLNKTVPYGDNKTCPTCNRTPFFDIWMAQGETHLMNISGVAKRVGEFSKWEPVFISTKDDIPFDESVSWEGKRDKATQAYLLCLYDYYFYILSNAFAVHQSSEKEIDHGDQNTSRLVENQDEYINHILKNVFDKKFGKINECVL